MFLGFSILLVTVFVGLKDDNFSRVCAVIIGVISNMFRDIWQTVFFSSGNRISVMRSP